MPESNDEHISVNVRRNEPVEKALKRLKKKLDIECFKDEMRKRKHYEKPSRIKHENRKRIKRRNKRQNQDDN